MSFLAIRGLFAKVSSTRGKILSILKGRSRMGSWQIDPHLSRLESDSILNAMVIDLHVGLLVPILRLITQLFSLVPRKNRASAFLCL